MKPEHRALLAYLLKHKLPDKILEWGLQAPHGSSGPDHRYELMVKDFVETNSDERCCILCLKPESWNQSPTVEDLAEIKKFHRDA